MRDARPLNALTVDVEEYFHSHNVPTATAPETWERLPRRADAFVHRLLDLCDAAGVRATFFVLGWMAERAPHLVRAIVARGHDLGCHSYGHRLVYAQDPEAFRADARRARAVIEDAGGVRVVGFRAPTYSITRASLWALDVLSDEGFTYDSSIFPIHHDRYGIPDAPRFPHRVRDGLWEFPLSTALVWGRRVPIAGGGYLRFFPYRLLRHWIRRVNEAEGQPVIITVHPWDIDPAQPRLARGLLNRFRQGVGLTGAEAKVQALLADVAFTTVPEALAACRARCMTG